MEHDEIMSPMVSTEGTLLTTVIEAQEGHDVAMCDIPNAFVQITEVWHIAHFWMSYGRCAIHGLPMGFSEGLSY